jgi:hypothetical protein
MTRYEPIVPDGQHLGTSHDFSGAVTGHLFSDGDNKLRGHAAWREVEDPEENHSSGQQDEPPRPLTPEEIERAAELATLMIVGIIKGLQWASPRLRRWWDGTAAPKLRVIWGKVRGRKDAIEALHLRHVSGVTFAASPAGAEVAISESKIRMSSAEWEQRLRAMLAAGAFHDEQRRILATAYVQDDERVVEGSSSQQELSPQEFAQRLQAMLEANPSLLSDSSSAEIISVLQRSPDDDTDSALQA